MVHTAGSAKLASLIIANDASKALLVDDKSVMPSGSIYKGCNISYQCGSHTQAMHKGPAKGICRANQLADKLIIKRSQARSPQRDG